MVVKVHHCLADGLAFSAFAMAMSDKYDAKNLPNLKPNPWYIDLMIVVLYPYLVIKTNVDVNIVKRNHHVMKKNIPISGKKTAAFSTDFDLSEIKKFTKSKLCSINDYMGALLGTGLYEYFEKHQIEDGVKYPIPDDLDTLVPFSFRQPIKDVKDV